MDHTLSYWEHNSLLGGIDVAVIGSGIVGLSCAIRLKERFPEDKIVVFERGFLPSGASTKNAGFACFGSASELLDDLNSHSPDEVLELVRMRVSGLERLRSLLGDEAIDYQQHGGYEVFLKEDQQLLEHCLDRLAELNDLLEPVFRDKRTILSKNDVFSAQNDPFSFKNTQNTVIFNQYEAQIDTGKMMAGLIELAQSRGVTILNSAEIRSISTKNDQILMELGQNLTVSAKKVCIATNGFAKQLIDVPVEPARAQVLITKPIPGLKLKGTFHLDRGYYYFRNINDRILFGGGRNLDFEGEQTTDLSQTPLIMDSLRRLLSETIIPDVPFEIENQWSGIMGVGAQKKAIVQEISSGVYCGVRLGGMGVAIGSTVGTQLADLVKS